MLARYRVAVGLFLVAMATLMTELVLMRVFDVILTTNIGYMIITGAMFAFGLSGVFVALFPLKEGADVRKRVALLAAGFGIAAVLLLPVLNFLPFRFDELYTHKVKQLLAFAALYCVLVTPFFMAGLIFTYVFSTYAKNIRVLYFFDLAGAAVGCVAIVPLVLPLGPGGLLFLAGAGALLAAACFAPNRGLTVSAAVVAAALAVVPLIPREGYISFRSHNDKRGILTAAEEGRVELTRWDPVSKIDVVRAEEVDEAGNKTLRHYQVAYDGGSQWTHFFPFDGDLAKLRADIEADFHVIPDHFWNRGVLASHWLRRDTDSNVLIIGSAGGQETKAALLFGAGSVDAVEMVGSVVELATGRYNDYIGGIFRDPRVHVRCGEGRSYIRSGTTQYDIIQIYSNHTSSSIAAGNGAVAPVYLQTADAYKDYFTHLSDDGILHINHHIFPRMVATAALAWKDLGRTDFRKHVLIYQRDGRDHLPTMLISMKPWTPEKAAEANAFMNRPGREGDKYKLLEDPMNPAESFLPDAFYSGEMPEAILASAPYRVSPLTDNQPYFNFLRKSITRLEPSKEDYLDPASADVLNSQLMGDAVPIPMDVVHFFVTGTLAAVFGVAFVILPLLFSKVGREHWQGKFVSIAYFSCLGAAFIIVEIVFIQKFMHLVGFPLYAYSVVIFTMLLAAALGSLSASALKISPARLWWTPFAAIVVCGLLLNFIHPHVAGMAMSMPMLARVALAGVLIFPMSFFMGMPLPLGILCLEHQPRGAIAWAWGMNGLFTVVGGIAAAVGSMFLGFNAMLVIAFAIYLVAALAMVRLRRLATEPAEDATEPAATEQTDAAVAAAAV